MKTYKKCSIRQRRKKKINILRLSKMTKKGTEKRQQNLIYFKHVCMLNDDDEEGRGKEKKK